MRTMVALCCCLWASAAIAQAAEPLDLVLTRGFASEELAAVSKPSEVERLTKRLQRTLNELSPTAKIQKCESMVHEYAGTEDEIYGAFCLVTVGHRRFGLFMCDDLIVGKFAANMTYSIGHFPPETVADFVRKSCPPGG